MPFAAILGSVRVKVGEIDLAALVSISATFYE